MGKITSNPQADQPDINEEELSDTTPGLVPDETDELVVESEGTPVVASNEATEDEKPPVDEKPAYTFKTQEELDAYVASKAKPEPVEPTEPVKPTTEEEDEELAKLEFWKGQRDAEGKWIGEAPKDWNDFARTIIKHLSPQKYAPKLLAEFQKLTVQERKEIENINKEFDAEYDDIAAQGLIPARNTKEGEEINKQISTIGGQYGIGSMKKAYELWSKIPKEQGGGLNYAAPTKPNPSKEASRLVGSSSKTQNAGKTKTPIPYDKLHSARSVDELIDEE